MFGLFKKKPSSFINFGSIGVDMHSHILPGIDDGAASIRDSIAMAKRFKALGFRKLIATPHIMADYFRNTPQRIQKSLELLQSAFVEYDIDLELEAAAEYYLDETFGNKVAQKELLTFGDNYVLFELSYINMPHNVEETIKRLNDAGYRPVLAHPERYPYFHNNIESYLGLRELGCALQVNTISLAGYYGKGSKRVAEELIARQAVDFLGSDMHHLRHADALSDTLRLPVLTDMLAINQLRNTGL